MFLRISSNIAGDIDIMMFRRFSRHFATNISVHDRNASIRRDVKTNIKAKLDYFVQSNQIVRYSPKEIERKMKKSSKFQKSQPSSFSASQKALVVLRTRYDNHIFQNRNGTNINLDTLSPNDLNVQSPLSKVIFENLLRIRKMAKIPIDERLWILLGTNRNQIQDPYLVTEDVLKLLERDQDTERATYLCRLAGSRNGTVGMNAILQWLLERGKVDLALRSFNDRKKWNLAPNTQTYVILFGGIAKTQQWGQSSKVLCERCIELFQSLKEGNKSDCSIEQFNACLGLLVKNFDDGQYLAWSFFDELIPKPDLHDKKLIPDRYTFTIFLNGIKKYHFHMAENIKMDRELSTEAKTLKLLENQSKLISTAQEVLLKVIDSATPPSPPTKNEAEANPEVLRAYREKIKIPLLEIDSNFVSVFISCFINHSCGTGSSTSLASHYIYAQRGLEYLQIWCPEIREVLQYAERAKSSSLNSLVKSTDIRVKKAITAYEDKALGSNLIDAKLDEIIPTFSSLESKKINPLVIFPPPPQTTKKTRAIFNGKKKPLVDFSRPLNSELKELKLDRIFKRSKGKLGKQMNKEVQKKFEEKTAVNKFLISLTMNGLIEMGKYEEFIVSVWYMLKRWGGMNADTEMILKRINEAGLFSDLLQEEPPKWNRDLKITRKFNEQQNNGNLIDIMLIEDVIYKINDSIRQSGRTGTTLALELLSTLVKENAVTDIGLAPRYKTFDVIFSCLVTDIHYFKDYNENQLTVKNKRRGVPDNTPRKSINEGELRTFLNNLNVLMDCVLVNESQIAVQKKYLIPNSFVLSYNRLIERLYNTTWLDVSPELKLKYHKQVIRSGILLYKTESLVNPNEPYKYSLPILQSIEYVYNTLKVSQELSTNDRKLMKSLKRLFQLDSHDPSSLEKLESINFSIYSHLSCKI
ncbi:uncharacterized protein PRCAT00004885001 [Priceomyces carsonii]|uniref:uncharacterized protein n=1 Tax=Priceomyces carsonii TaxID=28549 RepID=UPI002ED9F675|nr:unnamed protein product [Priceomyces carsonii]